MNKYSENGEMDVGKCSFSEGSTAWKNLAKCWCSFLNMDKNGEIDIVHLWRMKSYIIPQ